MPKSVQILRNNSQYAEMLPSIRLLPLLMERFPSSTHVRMIGLGGASDTAIWE